VLEVAPPAELAVACRALGLARATVYRRRRPESASPRRRERRAPPPRALAAEEQAQVLAVLHSERFVDPAPAQVMATLLDEGQYLCSVRTMYRLLEARGELHERRDRLVRPAGARQRIRPGQLTIHADRGSAPASKTVAQLLADLGVERSHSRPHVSNDNPFSESHFATVKGHPEFPDRFASFEHAQGFCRGFFPWYNTEQRHSGLLVDTYRGPRSRISRARWERASRAPSRSTRTTPTPSTSGPASGSCSTSQRAS
jgi:transposase InsO family protein